MLYLFIGPRAVRANRHDRLLLLSDHLFLRWGCEGLIGSRSFGKSSFNTSREADGRPVAFCCSCLGVGFIGGWGIFLVVCGEIMDCMLVRRDNEEHCEG